MRVLFASLASVGHTYPLIPLAVATRAAGHEVHFAAGENVHAPLAENGLRPFRPADSFYEIYTEDLAPELARLRPDLVVHGWGVPGAAIAAEQAAIPSLWHGFGRMIPAGIGLELPTEVAPGLSHLDICPPSLQDPTFVGERVALRPVPYSPPAPLPVWDDSKPLVYVTLGTAFGTAELLTSTIKALAPLDVHVLVATGRVTPSELGETPENVTVSSWVPQAAVLSHVDLVVHHGGSGTTLGALTVGVPQLVLPQGADQFANADALTAAGAALALHPVDQMPDAITAQARELLSEKDYRDAADGIAEEIARMPSPEDVARRLPDFSAR